MKKFRVIITRSAFLMLCSVLAFANDEVNFTGWVSDSECGAEHTKPGGKDCVEKCIKGGADVGHPEWKPQARVFVEESNKKVWTLINPDSLKGYEGDRVIVSARIQNDQKSLDVLKVRKLQE